MTRLPNAVSAVLTCLTAVFLLLAAESASATTYPLPTGASQMAVGDFNGDKFQDIVVISCLPNPCSSSSGGEVAVLLNKGDGTFATAKIIKLPNIYPDNIVAGDFNGDNKLDVAIAGYDPSTGNKIIQILQGNGKGGFRQLTPFATACTTFFPLVAADFNQDHKLDLACPSQFIPGNGNGTFGAAVAGGAQQRAIAGDFNSDNILDWIVGEGTIYLEIGNGNGTFGPEQKVLHAPSGIYSGAVGDFNLDKKLDLAIASYSKPNNKTTVTLLLGQGDGTFRRGSSIAAFSGTSQAVVLIADYNGDGFPDVVLLPYVFLNTGKGNLDAPTYTGVLAGPYGQAAVDLNNDGKADLAVVQQGSGGTMQLNVVLTE